MRYKTIFTLQAQLVDHNGATVTSEQLNKKLDGFACHSDSVLNYAELAFSDETGLRGGHPRLLVDDKGKLLMAVEIDSSRKLTAKEIRALREDFEGQLTDGIGAGCFSELTRATGISAVLRFPLKSKCAQSEGTAWLPKASTEKGNDKRIADAAKIITKLDSVPQEADAPVKKVAKKGATKESNKEVPAKQQKPNFNKLFRLLAKPERDQLIDQIKAELGACGNDLSMVSDGEYPYGNFSSPKLLRMLLDAGLPPETTDVKGYSLLIQAACEPKSIELLLKHGADVNRKFDKDDATALFRAARLGKRKSVELLLKHGADRTIKDRVGRQAADIVDTRSRDPQAIIDLLKT